MDPPVTEISSKRKSVDASLSVKVKFIELSFVFCPLETSCELTVTDGEVPS